MCSSDLKQVPAGPPMRVEIRIAGRIRFADTCYGVLLDRDDDKGEVTFVGALQPAAEVDDAPTMRAPEKWGEDVRDGEDVIQQVHSGSRK